MNDAALARIMESPQMPTLPAVAVQVLELTSRRDVELAAIARVVENDPAIAMRSPGVNARHIGSADSCSWTATAMGSTSRQPRAEPSPPAAA